MGNYISVQLTLFLRSILLGAVLGLAYDWARALRTLGGRLWGGLLDAAYCLGAVSSVFLFVLAGDGELRFFVGPPATASPCSWAVPSSFDCPWAADASWCPPSAHLLLAAESAALSISL